MFTIPQIQIPETALITTRSIRTTSTMTAGPADVTNTPADNDGANVEAEGMPNETTNNSNNNSSYKSVSWRKRMMGKVSSCSSITSNNSSETDNTTKQEQSSTSVISDRTTSSSSISSSSLSISSSKKLDDLSTEQCFLLLTKYFPSFWDKREFPVNNNHDGDMLTLIHDKMMKMKINGQDLKYVETVEDLKEILSIGENSFYSTAQLEDIVTTIKLWCNNSHNPDYLPKDVVDCILEEHMNFNHEGKPDHLALPSNKRKEIEKDFTEQDNKTKNESVSKGDQFVEECNPNKKAKTQKQTTSATEEPVVNNPLPTSLPTTISTAQVLPLYNKSGDQEQEEEFLLILCWQKLQKDGFSVPMPPAVANKRPNITILSHGAPPPPQQDQVGLLMRLRTIQQSLEKLNSWQTLLTILAQYPYYRRIVQLLCDAYLMYHHNSEKMTIPLMIPMNRMFLDLLTYYSMRCFSKKKGNKKGNPTQEGAATGNQGFFKATANYEAEVILLSLLSKVLRLSLYVVDNYYEELIEREKEEFSREKELTFSTAATLLGLNSSNVSSVPNAKSNVIGKGGVGKLSASLFAMTWKDISTVIHTLSALQLIDREESESDAAKRLYDNNRFGVNNTNNNTTSARSTTNSNVEIVLHVILYLQLVFKVKTIAVPLMKQWAKPSSSSAVASAFPSLTPQHQEDEEAVLKERFYLYLWSQCIPMFVGIFKQSRYQQSQSLMKAMLVMVTTITTNANHSSAALLSLQELWVSLFSVNPVLPGSQSSNHGNDNENVVPSTISCQVLVELLQLYKSNMAMIKVISAAIVPLVTPISSRNAFVQVDMISTLMEILFTHESALLSKPQDQDIGAASTPTNNRSIPIAVLQNIVTTLQTLSSVPESYSLLCAEKPVLSASTAFGGDIDMAESDVVSSSEGLFWLSLLGKYLDNLTTSGMNNNNNTIPCLTIANCICGILSNVCKNSFMCQRFLVSKTTADIGLCELLVDCMKKSIAFIVRCKESGVVAGAFTLLDTACSTVVTIMDLDASSSSEGLSLSKLSSSDLGCEVLCDTLKTICSASEFLETSTSLMYHLLRVLQGKVLHHSTNASILASLGCLDTLIITMATNRSFYCDTSNTTLLQESLHLMKIMCSSHVDNVTRCLMLQISDDERNTLENSSRIIALDLLLDLLHGYLHDKSSAQAGAVVKEICQLAELFFSRLPTVAASFPNVIGPAVAPTSSSWFSMMLLVIASHKENATLVCQSLSIIKLTIVSALSQSLAMITSSSTSLRFGHMSSSLSVLHEQQHQQQKILMTLRSLISVIEELLFLYRDHSEIVNHACCTIVSLLLALAANQPKSGGPLVSFTNSTNSSTSMILGSLCDYLQSPASSLCVVLIELFHIYLLRMQSTNGVSSTNTALLSICYAIAQLTSLKVQIAKKFVLLSMNSSSNSTMNVTSSMDDTMNGNNHNNGKVKLVGLISSTIHTLIHTSMSLSSCSSGQMMLKYVLNILFHLTNYPQLVVQCLAVTKSCGGGGDDEKDITIIYQILKLLLPKYCLLTMCGERFENRSGSNDDSDMHEDALFHYQSHHNNQHIAAIRKLTFGILKNVLRYEASTSSGDSSFVSVSVGATVVGTESEVESNTVDAIATLSSLSNATSPNHYASSHNHSRVAIIPGNLSRQRLHNVASQLGFSDEVGFVHTFQETLHFLQQQKDSHKSVIDDFTLMEMRGILEAIQSNFKK